MVAKHTKLALWALVTVGLLLWAIVVVVVVAGSRHASEDLYHDRMAPLKRHSKVRALAIAREIVTAYADAYPSRGYPRFDSSAPPGWFSDRNRLRLIVHDSFVLDSAPEVCDYHISVSTSVIGKRSDELAGGQVLLELHDPADPRHRMELTKDGNVKDYFG
jgi:hypothetical protein